MYASDETHRCGKPPANDDTSFCEDHQLTKAALREKELNARKESETTRTQIEQFRSQVSVPSYHDDNNQELSRVLPRMLEALDRVTEWEQRAYRNLMKIPEEDWRYQGDMGVEQLRSEVSVYERALDRTTRVLRDISKLNIDSRIAGIQQQQADIIATAFFEALARAEIPESQAKIVRDVFFQRLGPSGSPESPD